MMIDREHGGPDVLGTPAWDFSSNANACGPAPHILDAIQRTNPQHYPDPEYIELKQRLAHFHEVSPTRLVLAGSASEFIMRLTQTLASQGKQTVWIPPVAYGEYAHAAQQYSLKRTPSMLESDLCWICDPDSTIYSHQDFCLDARLCSPHVFNNLHHPHHGVVVLDRAYEPLRLHGKTPHTQDQLNRMWQLWTPNKALALTGIRGAYAIAPKHQLELAQHLNWNSPSWILGSHAVEMLTQWTTPKTQAWLEECRNTLRAWKALQMHLLQPWFCLPSQTNFFCMKATLDPHQLRQKGIKVRNATSLGLPGYWRLSVQAPAAQAALRMALSTKEAQ